MAAFAAPVLPPLAAGQEIGGFRLESLAHRGSMADLWAVSAVGPLPEPEAALPFIMKTPRVERGEEPAAIVGFQAERSILPLLAGPHVPRFVARGDYTRHAYIVMERIGGASLRPRFDAAPLQLDEVAAIGLRVAQALQDVHRQGLVHLDIKPSNIMFRPDGSAVLIDFGISRHAALPDLLQEEFTLPVGTSPYMSPEQVLQVRDDPRSDLFALGVMLYHLATGARPFGQPVSVRGLLRRLHEAPLPPRSLRADCPPWLQELILKCLEVDPGRRWQSAAEMGQALQEPARILLTERADRMLPEGRASPLRRWFSTFGARGGPDAGPDAAATTDRIPLILVALDVDSAEALLLDRLREAARRCLEARPGARLACVAVLRTARIGASELLDAAGRSRHVQQLAALQRWAAPIGHELGLADPRLTCHVLEAPDPAAALVEFAERTQVDHIVIGSRGRAGLRRYLGSVSAQVLARARCSVTVVRA
jgi:nucleotide-binding universal stress UspA family protein